MTNGRRPAAGEWFRLVAVASFVIIGISRSEGVALLLLYTAVWAISALGLGVVLGLANQPALCQASFMLVGAYVYGCLGRTAGPGLPVPVATLAAIAGAALIALALSPVLRIRGDAFALATIALDLLVRGALSTGDWLPGGQLGLVDVPALRFGSWEIIDNTTLAWTVGAALAVLAVVLHLRLGRGETRRRLAVLAEDEELSAALGTDPVVIKRRLFVVCGALGGLSGALYAASFGFIQPTSFGLTDSFGLAVAVVIGGRRRLGGAVLGAVIFQLAAPVLGDGNAEWRPVLLGAIAIVTMRFAPDGLLPTLRGLFGPLFPARFGAGSGTVEPSVAVPVQPADLSASQLTKSFGSLRALDDVSLALRPGRITAVVGPNGAGKSTLMGALAGVRPDTGAVEFDGVDVSTTGVARRARLGIARSFQHPRLVDRLDVLDNVLVGVDSSRWTGVKRLDERGRAGRAMAALTAVGLEGRSGDAIGGLSFSERRRLELARVLAAAPRIALVDEPSAGLDRSDQATLEEMMVNLAASGTTIVLVEHDLRFVEALSDDVVALVDGAVLLTGEPATVFGAAPFQDAYLGGTVGG